MNSQSRYYANTKYDKDHNPFMTTLFYYRDINDSVVCIAVPGWKSLDDMMKIYKESKR